VPRPIIGQPPLIHPASAVPAAPQVPLRGPQLLQRLRQTRSSAYVDAMKRLDVGAHHADRAALESLVAAIANEFPELGIEQRPLGIVSRCFLGSPYEVHICDLGGGIVQHFETFRSMPPLFERARSLASHPAYAFIEVYADTLRAVSSDGSVSVIDG
jgi:hypothetical protein